MSNYKGKPEVEMCLLAWSSRGICNTYMLHCGNERCFSDDNMDTRCPFKLTWVDSNPSMDNLLHPLSSVGWYNFQTSPVSNSLIILTRESSYWWMLFLDKRIILRLRIGVRKSGDTINYCVYLRSARLPNWWPKRILAKNTLKRVTTPGS